MTGNGKGFEIALYASSSLIKTRAWGCWDEDIVKKYDRALREKSEEIQTTGTGWYALVDLRRVSARSDEMLILLNGCLTAASAQGLKRIAYLGICAIPQAHCQAAFEKEHLSMRAFPTSEKEALQWLLREQ